LVIADLALRLPVLRTLSLCTCCRHYPGAAAGRSLRSTRPAISAFPDIPVGSACTSVFSRLARRSLTLRPAHAHGHQVATAIQRLQTFRHLHACSGCFRLERMPGGTCTHWKAPPCTAHGTRNHLKLLFQASPSVALRSWTNEASNPFRIKVFAATGASFPRYRHTRATIGLQLLQPLANEPCFSLVQPI
jgi:hypothetical protein